MAAPLAPSRVRAQERIPRPTDVGTRSRAPRRAHIVGPAVGSLVGHVAEGTAASALDHYLRDIGQYPLITQDEEAVLARRIRACDQDAVDALIRANLRFVVSVAKRYQHKGVLLDDLINEGNLGLMRAAHKFDEAKGIKFISYAVWWIRQAILQALADQGRLLRVPLNRAGTLHRIGRRIHALQQGLGRAATHAEMADGLALPHAEITEALAFTQSELSLDEPRGAGGDTRFLDYLADEHSAAPDEQATTHALAAAIAESLASLKARESRILRLYFGLDGEPLTLEEIGAQLGVTRERVRQIKEQALGRLRRAARTESLASFLH